MRHISAVNQTALEARALEARDFLWLVARTRDTGVAVTEGLWSDVGSVSAAVINPDTGLSITRDWYGTNIQTKREKGKNDAQTRSLSDMIFCMQYLCRRGGTQGKSVSSYSDSQQKNVSAAGLVALIKVDHPVVERIEGNDKNGKWLAFW